MLNQDLLLKAASNSCSNSYFSFATSSCCKSTGIEDEELHHFYYDPKNLNASITLYKEQPCPFCSNVKWQLDTGVVNSKNLEAWKAYESKI